MAREFARFIAHSFIKRHFGRGAHHSYHYHNHYHKHNKHKLFLLETFHSGKVWTGRTQVIIQRKNGIMHASKTEIRVLCSVVLTHTHTHTQYLWCIELGIFPCRIQGLLTGTRVTKETGHPGVVNPRWQGLRIAMKTSLAIAKNQTSVFQTPKVKSGARGGLVLGRHLAARSRLPGGKPGNGDRGKWLEPKSC